MSCNMDSIGKHIMWIGTLTYYVINVLGRLIPGGSGRYILLISIIFMIAGNALQNNFKYSFQINKFHVYLLMFALFTLASGFWAISSEITNSWATDFLGMFVMMIVVYSADDAMDSLDDLLRVVMYGGYIITGYVIAYFGWNQFLLIMQAGDRLLINTVVNANTLGLHAVYSLMIHLYLIMYKKSKIWYYPFSALCVVAVAVSSSRKALVALIMGALLLFVLKNYNRRDVINSALKNLFGVIAIIVVVALLLQLPLFSAMNERAQGLIAGLLGIGTVDSSTSIRQTLVEIGKDIFHDNPILGVGFENAGIIAGKILGRGDHFYLHNNYWEILADGGIVGFVVYYWMHIYIAWNIWKYRDFDDPWFVFSFSFFIILLVLDYGMVSSLDKDTYYQLMIIYMCTENLKRKYYECKIEIDNYDEEIT